jgi:putative ABC transport system permease protein
VVVEAATLAAVAIVLSLPLGIALALVLVGGSGDTTGTPAPFAFPWAVLPILALMAAVVAAGAAYLPARRASRVDPIDVMRFE